MGRAEKPLEDITPTSTRSSQKILNDYCLREGRLFYADNQEPERPREDAEESDQRPISVSPDQNPLVTHVHLFDVAPIETAGHRQVGLFFQPQHSFARRLEAISPDLKTSSSGQNRILEGTGQLSLHAEEQRLQEEQRAREKEAADAQETVFDLYGESVEMESGRVYQLVA